MAAPAVILIRARTSYRLLCRVRYRLCARAVGSSFQADRPGGAHVQSDFVSPNAFPVTEEADLGRYVQYGLNRGGAGWDVSPRAGKGSIGRPRGRGLKNRDGGAGG